MNTQAVSKKGISRLFSALLSFVMFCSMFVGVLDFTSIETSAFDPASYSIPTSGTTSSYYFRATPTVFEMGDGYAVIWVTSFTGTGYIKYTYQGKSYTVYDEMAGIVKTNENIHVVKVPHEHILDNTYTVYSQVVSTNNATTLTYGTTISCGPLKLNKYASEDEFNVLQLTDTHSYPDRAMKAAKQFSTRPDLIAFTGDIATYSRNKDDIINNVFGLIGKVSRGQFPVVYCRGNHETRGRYAAMLRDYFPTETGEFYYDFEYGPFYGIVMDTGEDKVDSHVEYGDTVNFKEYLKNEKAWLSTLTPSSKPFRMAIYHIPNLGNLNATGISFVPQLNALGLHFGICGHYHSTSWKASGSYSLNFPQLIMGGDPYGTTGDVTAARLTFKKDSSGSKTLDVRVASQNGNTKLDKSISISSTKASASKYAPVDFGLNQKTAITSIGLSFTAHPVVFETGDPDYYTVCFATSARTMGFVEYTYLDTAYKVFDESGGGRRTYDTLHTIQIPKAHLNNNVYRVGGIECTRHDPNHHGKGTSCLSYYYVFENRDSGAAVNVFNVPDLISSSSNNTEETVAAAVEALGTSPALIIANGDSRAVNNNAESIETMLDGLADISGSAHPVVYVRGDRDNLGQYVSQLPRYLSLDDFYYTVDYDNYTFVVVDTLSIASSHSSLNVGGTYLAEQNEWINSLTLDEDKTTVVLSHIPLDTYDAKSGYSWRSTLEAKGADLFMSGNDSAGSFGVSITDGNVLSVKGGGYKSSSSVGTAVNVLLSGDYAKITAVNNSGSTVYNKTFRLFGAVEVSSSIAAVEPTLTNGVYSITEAGNLVWMSENIAANNGFKGMTFRLDANVDMKLVPFTPIGGNTAEYVDSGAACNKFMGTFDGNNKTIKNLYVDLGNTNSYVGLFGYAQGATIKNLTLSGGSVRGAMYLGALVGTAENCTITGCFNEAEVQSVGTKVGTVAGLATGTTINSCGNFGIVSTTCNDSAIVGGLVGQSYANEVTNNFNNSFNRGHVIVGVGQASSPSKGHVGGLVGYSGSSRVNIVNCYNTGATVSYAAGGAGVVGSYKTTGYMTITNTYYVRGNAYYQQAFMDAYSDWSNAAGSGTVEKWDASSMKTQNFATTLNSKVFIYNASINDGYPVPAVFLNIDTSNAEYSITVDESSGLTISGGVLYGVSAQTLADELRQSITNETGITINGTGTGSTVTLTVDGLVVDTVIIAIVGDLDGDGAITASDYVELKNALVTDEAPHGIYAYAADANSDGVFTSLDLLLVSSYVSGVVTVID